MTFPRAEQNWMSTASVQDVLFTARYRGWTTELVLTANTITFEEWKQISSLRIAYRKVGWR